VAGGAEGEGGDLGPLRRSVELLRWSDALVLVFPTWWYGLPAILKVTVRRDKSRPGPGPSLFGAFRAHAMRAIYGGGGKDHFRTAHCREGGGGRETVSCPGEASGVSLTPACLGCVICACSCQGWVDRCFLPGVAFDLPTPATQAQASVVDLVPRLTNIKKVMTTMRRRMRMMMAIMIMVLTMIRADLRRPFSLHQSRRPPGWVNP
jgi:hypothetical protein